MLVTMDGNDSLKCVQQQAATPINPGEGDTSLVGKPNEHQNEWTVEDEYYIPQETVDLWEHD